jgi:leucyl aminopeptidase
VEVEKIRVIEAASSDRLEWADGWLIFAELPKKSRKLPDLKAMPAALFKNLATFHERNDKEISAGHHFTFDNRADQRVCCSFLPEKAEAHWYLKHSRESYERLKEAHCRHLAIDVRNLDAHVALAVDAAVSAVLAAHHRDPSYAKKPEKPSPHPKLTIVCNKSQLPACKAAAADAALLAAGTNFVRYLTKQAANDLNCKSYVELTKKIAAERGLEHQKWDVAQLKKMGAGAFLAVCQGSPHPDAAIVRLTYQPKKSEKSTPERHLALVGKGVVYDTGGINVKPANYMYGMQTDMGGSAIALALVQLAAIQQWPIKVSAYLAIAQNDIGPNSYKPNDIVHSLTGKSIEIIHTDAEGRMMLSDTLTLASREKPNCIVDFATLTGSCVRAIGDRYSGGFTNRSKYAQEIIEAGVTSGERVWPFPLDTDFGEPLKSDIADIKQCRLSGGPDHIEAAYFLNQFIENDVDWIHIDLAAFDCEGGLAHVADKFTGFGVRFGNHLAKRLMQL